MTAHRTRATGTAKSSETASGAQAAEQLTIRAFRAVDDRERCVRFLLEHIRVLEDIGVISVIKPDISWCIDPNVIVVVAEHPRLGMVAGIRLHVARPGMILPMESSMKDLDPNISAKLSALTRSGTAEVAGLWNAHRFSGRGVPMLLMGSVVSLANQMGVKSLVTFIAEYVAPYARKCGFVMMSDLAFGGDFVYPVPSIRTHAMVLPDAVSLSTAMPQDRQRLMSLRLRPSQSRVERPKQMDLDVTYELIVDPGMAQQYDRLNRWWRRVAA